MERWEQRNQELKPSDIVSPVRQKWVDCSFKMHSTFFQPFIVTTIKRKKRARQERGRETTVLDEMCGTIVLRDNVFIAPPPFSVLAWQLTSCVIVNSIHMINIILWWRKYVHIPEALCGIMIEHSPSIHAAMTGNINLVRRSHPCLVPPDELIIYLFARLSYYNSFMQFLPAILSGFHIQRDYIKTISHLVYIASYLP